MDIDRELTREQRAMTHAATGMVENFTAQTGFHYRYGLHMQVCLIIFDLNNLCKEFPHPRLHLGIKCYCSYFQEFLQTLRLGEYFGSEKAIKYWGMFQPYTTRLRNFMSGVSRQETATIWQLANQDLAALSAWLGSSSFFHGGAPSTLDCVVFGHLAQFLFIDIGFPQKVVFFACIY